MGGRLPEKQLRGRKSGKLALEVLGGSPNLHSTPKNSTNRSDNTPSPDSAPEKIYIYRRKNRSVCGKLRYFVMCIAGGYLSERMRVRGMDGETREETVDRTLNYPSFGEMKCLCVYLTCQSALPVLTNDELEKVEEDQNVDGEQADADQREPVDDFYQFQGEK